MTSYSVVHIFPTISNNYAREGYSVGPFFHLARALVLFLSLFLTSSLFSCAVLLTTDLSATFPCFFSLSYYPRLWLLWPNFVEYRRIPQIETVFPRVEQTRSKASPNLNICHRLVGKATFNYHHNYYFFFTNYIVSFCIKSVPYNMWTNILFKKCPHMKPTVHDCCACSKFREEKCTNKNFANC